MTLTRSIVKLSTILARPKSATLTLGGLSFVKRIFYERKWVDWPLSRSSQGTSGLRSRCVMPCAWIYYIYLSVPWSWTKTTSRTARASHIWYVICFASTSASFKICWDSSTERATTHEGHYEKRCIREDLHHPRIPGQDLFLRLTETSTGKIAWLTYITVILKENLL